MNKDPPPPIPPLKKSSAIWISYLCHLCCMVIEHEDNFIPTSAYSHLHPIFSFYFSITKSLTHPQIPQNHQILRLPKYTLLGVLWYRIKIRIAETAHDITKEFSDGEVNHFCWWERLWWLISHNVWAQEPFTWEQTGICLKQSQANTHPPTPPPPESSCRSQCGSGEDRQGCVQTLFLTT